jgi:hypothetical protein
VNNLLKAARGNLGYLLSLPERVIRAIAAALGGAIYEATEVLLPGWLRGTRLYRAIVAGLLRISIELVGGAKNILPEDDIGAGELAVRKAAGTGIEVLGLLTMGWSPLWLFAVVADLTGGTRVYLRELVSQLKQDGVLSGDANVASVEELLNTLEGSSGVVAEALDIPPLSVGDMRASWQVLRDKSTDLPDTENLASLFRQLQQVAKQENSSVRSVSSLIAAGAVRAGVRVGQVYIFDFYQDALQTINKEGLSLYSKRVTFPYLAVARSHFDSSRPSYTERLVTYIQQRTGRSADKTPGEVPTKER